AEYRTRMQLWVIENSVIDHEKSTARFEARIATGANAFNSPGRTITFPDCDVPCGFDGVKRAAIKASCNPPDALPIVYPAGCALVVVNCNVPESPFAAQLPPVTSTASALPVPEM